MKRAAAPEPIADTPLAAVLGRPDELAKAWLIELLAARPLAAAPELPVAALARDGPDVCAAVVRALAEPADGLGGATELLRQLGDDDQAQVVWAVEALRRAVWLEVVSQLGRPAAELVAELADRLGYVCALLTAGTLGGSPAWLAPIERALGDRAPFAVLVVEIADRERLAATDLGEDLFDRAELGLAARLRTGERLVRELPGRWWVLAPDVDREVARRRGETLAAALDDAHHGVPLACSVGVALSPGDGQTAEALAERAEQELLVARAAGLGVAPA
jgi:GGDEF domain-containing protein